MRGGSLKVGKAFGINIRIHWTFFLLLLFFAGYGYAQCKTVVGALLMTALIVMLFCFVVLHEYGHSLVATRLGIEIEYITLLPIGGMARMKTLPEKPLDEVKIAVAGPLVNVVLDLVLYGIAYLGFGSAPSLQGVGPQDGGRLARERILLPCPDQRHTTLIVVGSRGLGVMGRIRKERTRRLGSVSTKVIRAAGVPVLLCREG
jgi:membrane-associated protease RseP (regulator of RpoE activity)